MSEEKLELLTRAVYDLNAQVAMLREARTPIDFPIQLSQTMPWNIDYKNRKHLFIWSPNFLTISLEDYGVLSLNSNMWHNIDFPAGMRILATNISSPVYAYIKATDDPTILDYQGSVSISAPLATPGDNISNPSSIVASEAFLMGWNGALWDRIQERNGSLRTGLSSNYTAFATGAATTVIKGFPGDLVSIVINTAGTTAFQIFDNATTGSGQVLYNSATTTSQGQVITVYGYAKNGITLVNTASGPAGLVYFG